VRRRTVATPVARRCGERTRGASGVGEKGGEGAVQCPELAAWSPWDRRSQQGTGGCAWSVGGAAGVATVRDVARGRERRVLLT
jgi:hypothetical protein